jgi:hypothetical protein
MRIIANSAATAVLVFHFSLLRQSSTPDQMSLEDESIYLIVKNQQLDRHITKKQRGDSLS